MRVLDQAGHHAPGFHFLVRIVERCARVMGDGWRDVPDEERGQKNAGCEAIRRGFQSYPICTSAPYLIGARAAIALPGFQFSREPRPASGR